MIFMKNDSFILHAYLYLILNDRALYLFIKFIEWLI